MNCQEVRTFLQVYLDGEFGEEERAAVERHLGNCPECRAQADYERRFRDAIRARIPRPAAPPEFRQRLVERLAAPPVPRRISRPLLWGSIPAAAALAMVITFTWTVTSGFNPLVGEAISRHSSAPPVEMNSSNSDEVEGWFRAKVDFHVDLPRFSPRQLDLVGARLSHLAERQAAMVRYRHGARQFSLLVVSDPGGDLGVQRCKQVHQREYCLSEERGYTVVLWRSRGLVYSLVGETPAEQLLELLSNSQ